MTRWHEQEEWWVNTAQVMFGRDSWETAPLQVDQTLALAGLEPPVRVLDMPCGVGRHALAFARLDCHVTAVDRTAAYLDQARTAIEGQTTSLQFIQGDMREFVRPGAFDLAVNLFTSFGYFEDEDENLRVLRNFHESLRPGGVLVMDLKSKEILAREFTPHDWRELEDGTLLVEERKVTHDWTWMEVRWLLIRGGERRDYPFSYRLYSASELKQMLVETGFTPIRVYGDLSGTAYDHTARRLVLVASKLESQA